MTAIISASSPPPSTSPGQQCQQASPTLFAFKHIESTMDEKLEYRTAHQNKYPSYHRDMPNPRLSRSRRILIALLALVLPVYALISFLNAPGSTTFFEESPQDYLADQNYASALVPLEAHVMSKCPDARDCLRDLVVPTMEKIADKADFRLSFIGT